MKKKFNKRKKNKEEKNQIGNILKGKKIKGKKLVIGVWGIAWLCAIHGAIVKNILFENGGGANIIRAFNPTQLFLYLKKNVIDPLQSAGQYASYYIII
jgi:hypothetical protein